MPRFGLSTPSFSSPLRGDVMTYDETSREATSFSSSVRLSCLSPDGRAVHSLEIRESSACIETHALPLAGTVEGGEMYRSDSIPSVVTTVLPSHVYSSIRRYPALELLCVDVNTDSNGGFATNPNRLRKLPLLCLYSQKDVFLLEMGYEIVHGATEVEGVILNVIEPFDETLIGNSTSVNIIRIRQAPQQFKGYCTLCPPGAMAMLSHDIVSNEYTLNLYHGIDSTNTSPVVQSMEQLDEQLDRITDFCFCQSNDFSFLSSISVVFLKASGDVLQASPVLFRGTVVPRDCVASAMEYLEALLQKTGIAAAKRRQYTVAMQYVSDCFPDRNARGHFLTATERSDAFDWPSLMQGPILLPPESDEVEMQAVAIEPIQAGEMCGLVIGHTTYKLEFGMIAPSIFVPRFQHESQEDTAELDQDLKWGTIVSCVDLQEGDCREDSCNSLALIIDPIMNTVVHYVTPSNIQSVSTNALKIASNEIRQAAGYTSNAMFSPPSRRRQMRPRTTGWACLDVSSLPSERSHVVGTVVSGDIQYGHVLIARLSNGSMLAINQTETRQLQEMEGLRETGQLTIDSKGSSKNPNLAALHDTASFVEVAQPLVEKVTVGLRGMGKIVGSATTPEKITPEILAAAVTVKEQCDMNVVLPMIELGEQVNARKKAIVLMFNDQMEQLKALRVLLTTIKEKEASITEKVEIVTLNAESLAKRSASALQSTGDLMPTITQAEFDYFKELQRLQEKCRHWQEQLDRLKHKASTIQESIEDGIVNSSFTIDTNNTRSLNQMLEVSGKQMFFFSEKLEVIDSTVEDLEAVAGIERDQHGLFEKKQ